MDQDFLNKLEYKRQLRALNTNALFSISTLITKCSIINVYEENLPDEKIVDMASELEMISEKRGNKIMYTLQSTNKIIAYEVEFYQVSQCLNSNSYLTYNTNFKTVDIRQCSLEDKSFTEFNQILCDNHVEFLDTLIFSQCSLTTSSFSAVLEILKCCVINHLIVSDNSICNKALCNLILDEVTLESKVLNFRMSIPMTISFNEVKSLFLINIGFNDAIANDYDLVNSQLHFSNIGLNEVNIESFLMICKSNILQVNLFEMNTMDELINDILTELESFEDNTYVIASNTRLIACNAKQKQIMETVDISLQIKTLKLVNCEISLSELCPLGKLLSKSTHNWNLIDLSGCKIKDEGCLQLYEHLSAVTPDLSAVENLIHIEVLNLSSNCLEADSIIITLQIFGHCNCVIKTLIISWNDIPICIFNEALEAYLLAKKQFLNFKHEIPLMVYESQPPFEILMYMHFKHLTLFFHHMPTVITHYTFCIMYSMIKNIPSIISSQCCSQVMKLKCMFW